MSAYTQPWKSITGVPAENFATKRYTAVTFNADGKVVSATADGQAVGIIYEPNNIDEPAQVVAQGFAYCVFGGTVATGDALSVGTGGKLVKATSGVVIGIAAVGGTADSIGTVLLK